MEQHDERRLKMWRALSDLFLDTEIDDVIFDYIARTIVETGYSTKEVHEILWAEIFPVLEINLRDVAGNWTGWTDEWLLNNIKISTGTPAIQSNPSAILEIKRCWQEVIHRIPTESRNAE